MVNCTYGIKHYRIYQFIYILCCISLTSCSGGGGGSSAKALPPASVELLAINTSSATGNGTSNSPYIINISNSNEANITIAYKNMSNTTSNFYVILPTFDKNVASYTLDASLTTCGTSSSNSTLLASQATCNLVISPSTIGNNQSYPMPHISSNGYDSQPLLNGSSTFFVNFGTAFTEYLGAVDANKNNLLFKCNYDCNTISQAFSNSGNGVFITNNNLNVLYIGVDAKVYYLDGSNVVTIANNITSISNDSIQSITQNESLVIVGTKYGIISQCSNTSCTQLANLSSLNFESLTQVITIEGVIYALGNTITTGNSVIYSNANNWSTPVLNLPADFGTINNIVIKNTSSMYLGGEKNHSGIIYIWNGITSTTASIFDPYLGGGDIKTMELSADKLSLYVAAASNTYKCNATSQTTDCPTLSPSSFNSLSSTAYENNVYFGGLRGKVYSSIIGWQDPFISVSSLVNGGQITSLAIH